MRLKVLKEIIDKAYEYAGHTAENSNVYVCFKKSFFEIRKVTQMGVIPDVFIEIGEKISNE